MKEAERQEEQSSSVVVKKPLWQRAVKKTGTALDWTLLPITEVKKLGASVGMMFSFIATVFFTLVNLVRHGGNLKSLQNVKHEIRKFHNPEIFYSRLNNENKELISNLDSKFFIKRWCSIWFCLLVCFAGILAMGLSITVDGFSIIKTTFSLIMLAFMLAYTWCSIVNIENLKFAQNRLRGDE